MDANNRAAAHAAAATIGDMAELNDKLHLPWPHSSVFVELLHAVECMANRIDDRHRLFPDDSRQQERVETVSFALVALYAVFRASGCRDVAFDAKRAAALGFGP